MHAADSSATTAVTAAPAGKRITTKTQACTVPERVPDSVLRWVLLRKQVTLPPHVAPPRLWLSPAAMRCPSAVLSLSPAAMRCPPAVLSLSPHCSVIVRSTVPGVFCAGADLKVGWGWGEQQRCAVPCGWVGLRSWLASASQLACRCLAAGCKPQETDARLKLYATREARPK